MRELMTCESELDRGYLTLLHKLASDRQAAAQRRQVADALIGSSLQQITDRICRLALAGPVRCPADTWTTVNGETWSFQVKFHQPEAPPPEEPATPSRRRGLWARLMPGQARDRSRVLPALGAAGILVAHRIPVAVRPPIDVDVLPVLYPGLPKLLMPGTIWLQALSPGTTGEAIPEQSEPPQDSEDTGVGAVRSASGCGCRS